MRKEDVAAPLAAPQLIALSTRAPVTWSKVVVALLYRPLLLLGDGCDS